VIKMAYRRQQPWRKTKRGKSFYSKKHRSRGYYIYENNKKVGFIKQKSSRRYR